MSPSARTAVERIHRAYKAFVAAEPRYNPSPENERTLLRALFRSVRPEDAENPAAWHSLFAQVGTTLAPAPNGLFHFLTTAVPALSLRKRILDRPTFAAPAALVG